RFNFGYSPTNQAGGRAAGELGGLVFRGDCRWPGRMAYYGDRLSPLALDKPLRATGRVCLHRGVTDSTVLLGFFHSTDSIRVSQEQNAGLPECFLGVCVEGPSREGFFFYPAYRAKGNASGNAGGPKRPYILPNGSSHEWALTYLPDAAGG